MKKQKSKKAYFVVVSALTLSFALYYLAFPPVELSLKFDPSSKVVMASITNKSSRNVSFYDTLSIPQPTDIFPKNAPPAIRVKVFSPDGKVISKFSKDSDGYINAVDYFWTLRALPIKDMARLSPYQTISSEVKLRDLIGTIQPYAELTSLKAFCVQFRIKVFFNPYLLFPIKENSEVVCINEAVN